MWYMFCDTDNCETLTFENCRIRPSKASRAFTAGYDSLKRINGVIDLTVCSDSDMFYFARKLEHFEIAPNSMLKTYSLKYAGNFDDNTLVSIANALNPESPTTVDLKNYTSRMQSMNGNIEDGMFILNESGDMSLDNFITTVKGWTIA